MPGASMFSEESGSDQELDEEDQLDSAGEIWRASESPVESFSDAEGADSNGHWAVNIVGEEIDSLGKSRYEARWDKWTRADGSNVTWDNSLLHRNDIKHWKRIQTAKRNNLALESLDIDIWATTDVHNTNTRRRAQAFDEKQRERKRTPLDLRDRMEKLLAEKKEDMEDVQWTSPPPPERPHAPISSSASISSSTRSRTYGPDSSSTRSRTYAPESSSSHSKAHAPNSAISTPRSTTAFSVGGKTPVSKSTPRSPMPEPRPTRPLPSRALRTSARQNSRHRLELEWNAAARSCGAAAITVVNEVDEEEIPPLPPNFRYIESEYEYSKKVLQVNSRDCFVRCECDRDCDVAVCSCQEPSQLVDEDGRKMSAYTPEGLFAFNVPRGVEVIECNDYCSCDPHMCPNRVAQQPRDVPVEIFKTNDRGWGVRAPVDVERGKVLGIYTGLIVPRDVADILPEEESSYCFDLDGNEDPNGEPPDGSYSYSVDSRTRGNWSRFINHSCSPNLRIYLVVYDTIPELNTPYLAFVATHAIPAGSEFTFDYDPAAVGKGKGKGKGKAKAVVPDGARPCMCGAAACRGWVRV